LSLGNVVFRTHTRKIVRMTGLYVCPYGSDLRAPFARGALFFCWLSFSGKLASLRDPFHTGPYAKLCGRFDTRMEAQEKAARAALPSLFHKEPYWKFTRVPGLSLTPSPEIATAPYSESRFRKDLTMQAKGYRWLPLLGVTLLGFSLGAASLATSALAQSKEVVVFAAASLKNALDEAAAGFAKDTGKPAPKISYAASNTLAKQIEAGAPADVFLSADLDWMDYLASKDLIRPDTRVNLLGNRLVLIAPKDATVSLTIGSGFDLATALGSGKLAMANVDAVPAGKYGKAALERFGVWEAVKSQVAQADNVRGALLLVSRGEAPLGIVYQTDAAADPNVKIVGVFPEDSHPPIIYPMAVTKDSTHADAVAFVTYLRSGASKPAFEKQGFTVLNKPTSGS
jgi:molybdate transport system substrate-binding protein